MAVSSTDIKIRREIEQLTYKRQITSTCVVNQTPFGGKKRPVVRSPQRGKVKFKPFADITELKDNRIIYREYI